MSRVFVTNDQRTAHVEICDPDDAPTTAACDTDGWGSESSRADALEETIESARIHVDREHR